MLDNRSAKAAVRPRLPSELQVERQQARHLVVIEAARRTNMDQQPIDIGPLQSAIIQRRDQCPVAEGGDAFVSKLAKSNRPNSCDCSPGRTPRFQNVIARHGTYVL
jgi:hypothetical protein